MNKKLLLALCGVLQLTVSAAFAENKNSELHLPPAPFGISLAKSTCNDVKEKFTIEETKKLVKGEKVIWIAPDSVKLRGVKRILVYCNKNDVVDMVIVTMYQSRFDAIYQSLSEKYVIVNKNIAFVGNKTVRFHDGDFTIYLNAPHMSFDMDLLYASTKKVHELENKGKLKEAKKKNEEKAML